MVEQEIDLEGDFDNSFREWFDESAQVKCSETYEHDKEIKAIEKVIECGKKYLDYRKYQKIKQQLGQTKMEYEELEKMKQEIGNLSDDELEEIQVQINDIRDARDVDANIEMDEDDGF